MYSTGKFYRKNILRALILILLILAAAVVPTIAQSDCYPHDTVYITGGVNVRESATTDSQVVATARAGDSFTVSQSRQGDTWCWLKISNGWIAKTSRVSSTEPSTSTSAQSKKSQQPVQEQSIVNNCCFIGWECQTDEEWQSGYWAYQSGQCDSPSQWPKQWSQVKQQQQQQRQTPSGGPPSPVERTLDPDTGKYTFTYSDGVVKKEGWSLKQGESCESRQKLGKRLPPECYAWTQRR